MAFVATTGLDRIAVTVAGGGAWLFALWLIVRLRHTRRVAAVHEPAAPRGERLARSAARVTGSVAGAALAGALVLGLGGRLLMRILAATSPDSVQGGLTEAEEVIGDVTLSGTLGLVVFVGIFGGLAGLAAYSALRRWLPDASVTAGLITGAVVAAPLARMSGLLDPDNPDFAILRPTWLAVALIATLLVTFALLAATLIDRWANAWPRPGWSSLKGRVALLPLLPMAVLPPAALLILAAIGIGASPRAVTLPSGLDRVVTVVVRVVAAAGGGYLLLTVAEIL